jgi:hypothetical protein
MLVKTTDVGFAVYSIPYRDCIIGDILKILNLSID